MLTNPFAGWTSKQWPFENYRSLAAALRGQGLTLVVNVSPGRSADFTAIPNITVHVSSLAGLIDATRRATAVLGLDSGPLHLAAALGKPGVGLYGPTDPARNGPYGGTIRVLRSADAETTYKRGDEIHPSMRAISVESVAEALMQSIASSRAGVPAMSGMDGTYWFPKPYADAVARLRVPCGFVLLVAFALLSQPSIESIEIGLPIAVSGLVTARLGGWPSGEESKPRNQRPLFLHPQSALCGHSDRSRGHCRRLP